MQSDVESAIQELKKLKTEADAAQKVCAGQTLYNILCRLVHLVVAAGIRKLCWQLCRTKQGSFQSSSGEHCSQLHMRCIGAVRRLASNSMQTQMAIADRCPGAAPVLHAIFQDIWQRCWLLRLWSSWMCSQAVHHTVLASAFCAGGGYVAGGARIVI